MGHHFPGEVRGAHTFPPHTFPPDGRGNARVICLCGGANITVNIDSLPEEPETDEG